MRLRRNTARRPDRLNRVNAAYRGNRRRPPVANLPDDPLAADGIAGFGRRLRRGETTAEAATQAYLQRIDALDPHLGAYQHVASELALTTAKAIDAQFATGSDLGPLMGVR